MRKVLATGGPSIPGRLGAMCAEKVVEEWLCIFTRDWRHVRGDGGDGSARQHTVDWRGGIELCTGAQAREDYEGQVVLYIFGRISLHRSET